MSAPSTRWQRTPSTPQAPSPETPWSMTSAAATGPATMTRTARDSSSVVQISSPRPASQREPAAACIVSSSPKMHNFATHHSFLFSLTQSSPLFPQSHHSGGPLWHQPDAGFPVPRGQEAPSNALIRRIALESIIWASLAPLYIFYISCVRDK